MARKPAALPLNKTWIRKRRLQLKLGGYSDTTVWRRVKDGSLPEPVRVGGLLLWDEAAIDAALEARGKAD